MKTLRTIDNFISKIEWGFIVLFLTVMVILNFYQVIIRNFWYTSLVWGDELSRHLVLWVSFIGASLATRERKHIKIDVITRTVPPGVRIWLELFLDIVGAAGCLVLAFLAMNYIGQERELQDMSLALKSPVWALTIILPIAFFLIVWRKLLQVLDHLLSIIKGQELS